MTQGLFALVDGEDYERLSKHKWCANKNKKTHYAVRHIGKWPNQQSILMHREILNVPIEKETDHRNGYGLDNRGQNLRICTCGQNQYNRQSYKGTSQYKGVSWENRRKKWRVRIQLNGKEIYFGQFDSEVDAARAYDKKAVELFGEFARTNF